MLFPKSHYLVAISIRLWSISFALCVIAYIFINFHNYYAFSGLIFLALLPVEFLFSFRNNDFKENKYFNTHLFLFTFTILPSIWILYINRLMFKKSQLDYECSVSDHPNQLHKPEGIAMAYTEDKDMIFLGIESAFMITLILAQWLLPKNQTDAEDTYSLVINALSMSLDMHDLFLTSFKTEILCDLDNISGMAVSVAILSAWSCSLILLTLNSDAKTKIADKQAAFESTTRSIMSQRNYRAFYFKWDDQEYLPIIFENFYWKYVIVITAMDGPFFMIRMIVMFNYKIDVKQTFFLFKNLIQTLLQLIRILGRIYFRMA